MLPSTGTSPMTVAGGMDIASSHVDASQDHTAEPEALQVSLQELDNMITESVKTSLENMSPDLLDDEGSRKRQRLDLERHSLDRNPSGSLDNQTIDSELERVGSSMESSATQVAGLPISGNALSEKDDLAMMALQLEHATGEKKSAIPADLELYKTSSAFQAYLELLSQLPPLAVLSNAHLAALPLPIVAASYLPPRIQLLINTLPTLDNLATQLLRIVTIGPYQHIIDVASKPDTPDGAAFRDLTSLFEFTKRLYSEEDPFITVEHLAPGLWKEGEPTPSMFRYREQSIESTLRKVNLATFTAATLGTIDVGFFYLNESFLDVFCPSSDLLPENALSNMGSTNMSLQSAGTYALGDRVGKLLKPQLALYLELKTQAYISAVEAGERLRQDILDDIFPESLHDQLCERRKAKKLSHIEVQFVEQCQRRKEQLLQLDESLQLSEHYEWFVFLKDLFDHILHNMGFLVWGRRGKTVRRREPSEAAPHSAESLAQATDAAHELSANGGIEAANAAVASLPNGNEPISAEDYEKLQAVSNITSSLLPLEIQQMQLHLRMNTRQGNNRIFNRRPWTKEEEKALRQALELKGPQWLTILELFGNGGKILEALKGRTQVQIKDKARNWKMFFLKLGLPIPDYLHRVTGDLDRDDRSRSKRLPALRKTNAAPVPLVLNQK